MGRLANCYRIFDISTTLFYLIRRKLYPEIQYSFHNPILSANQDDVKQNHLYPELPLSLHNKGIPYLMFLCMVWLAIRNHTSCTSTNTLYQSHWRRFPDLYVNFSHNSILQAVPVLHWQYNFLLLILYIWLLYRFRLCQHQQ